MSTKTTFKRVALVTVAALGFGSLSIVAAPMASAATSSISLNTTSLTVVGGTNASDTPSALIRINTTSDTAGTYGLTGNEKILVSIVGVPTSASAKTSAANGLGGATISDSSTFAVTASDLIVVEHAGQTSGSVGTVSTALDATTSYTNWNKKIANATITSGTTDTTTNLVDGTLTSANSKFVNMDGGKSYPASIKVASYYVALMPRAGASVIDQGVYTVRFTFQDTDGNNTSFKDLKIDFVSSKNTAGATLALAATGTFVAGTALGTTGAAGTASLKMTLTNRDGGRIVSHIGHQETPTMKVFDSLAVETMTGTVLISDTGTSGIDFGNTTSENLIPNDGVYGVRMAALPAADTVSFSATYGNATAATAAVTVYAATTGYSASTVVTATGSVSTATTLTPYTVPLTTKSAVVTVTVVNSSSVAVQDYPVRFSTAWTNCAAGDATPVTGSTGATTVMTNSSGKASLTITCGSPADATSATVSVQYGATAGTSQVINWAKSKPATVSVSPGGPMTVALKAVTTATFTVTDAFGAPVVGTVMNLSVTGSNNTTASPLLIPSATTDAKGQVSYTLTDALAIAAGTDAITATSVEVPTATKTLTLTYATTVPVAAAMKVYFDPSEATWTTLVPATTIYESGTTGYTLNQGKNIAKSLTPTTKTASDDVIGFNAYVETAALAAASGLPVLVSISDGGWILSSAGLPSASRTLYTSSTGYTGLINVTATTPGTKTITFTVGTVTSTATLAFTNGTTGTTGRFVTVTAGSANASAVASGNSYPSFTAKVTDGLGNAVAGAMLNIVATGVGRLTTGGKTAQWTTDATGSYTFELVSTEEGAATVTVTATTSGAQHSDIVGYIGATAQSNTALAAGIKSATGTVTFAAGQSATDVAQAATDAAAEATDAANAATDAANAAAEAADAATAAAQDAADAVAALSTQVSEMVNALKKQITALTNLVIKIQKKVKA
jgi:trimeric autotransporter adhesin